MSTCKEEAKMAFDFIFIFFKFQIKTLQQENSSLKKQCQKVKEQFLQQKVIHLFSFCIYQPFDKYILTLITTITRSVVV